MNIKKIIREEVDDFDWIKQSDPYAISDRDLRRFNDLMTHRLAWSNQRLVIKWSLFDSLINVIDHYLGTSVSPNSPYNVFWSQMSKLKSYLIHFALNNPNSDPYTYIVDILEKRKDLLEYIKQDSEFKRIYNEIKKSTSFKYRVKNFLGLNESNGDEFDWVRDIKPIEPYPVYPTKDRKIRIGGGKGLPICYIKYGDRVKFIPSEEPTEPKYGYEFIFTVEEYDGWGSWGSDLPIEHRYCEGDGEINHWNNNYLTHPEYGNVVDDMIFTKD